MSRACVTGADGFMGRALVAELVRRGIEVDPIAGGGEAPLDLSDETTVRARLRSMRPDLVFHLAGSFRADGYAALMRVNCALAAVLLDALSGEGMSDARVVLVGSAAEYGLADASEPPVDESRETRPISAYGASKLAQTELGLAAARAGRRVLVVRPSNVIGPGVSELLAIGSFARQARDVREGRAEPILRVGDLSAVRDFVDVRDVVAAMIDLAETERAFGRVINIARGEGHTMREALDALIEAFGIDVEVRTDTARGSQSASASRFVASPALLASLVAWQPRSLSESMRSIAQASFSTQSVSL